MLFNSIDFLIFFPLVTALYFLLPQRLRWVLLLAASCVFYMFFIPIYVLILFVTITIDYFAGLYIEKSSGRGRVFFLSLSIVSLCAFLFFFKYFNFFNANFEAIARFLDLRYPIPALRIILPIGLSFHTFQSLSYVIEVFRGNQKAERNYGIYALYVMFYPQLVAGPIERPQNLLHQFYERHRFEPRRVVDGLKLMMWGMFKKVVIADRLAVLVNQVYDHSHDYTGIWLILATVFFSYGAGIWRWYHTPHSFTEVGRWTVIFIYLPMLGVVLWRGLVKRDKPAIVPSEADSHSLRHGNLAGTSQP